MPRAKKGFEQSYSSQRPPSQQQMCHGTGIQSQRNFRENWNFQFNHRVFSGRPQYPSRGPQHAFNGHRQEGYFRPNFHRGVNQRCPGFYQSRFNGAYNFYENMSFDNQTREWRQEPQQEPSYRASCFTTFNNCPGSLPLLRNLTVVCPSDFESGDKPTTSAEQIKTEMVNCLQPDVTKPESHNMEIRSSKTDSKLDYSQTCSELKTRSDSKANVNTQKTDQDFNTTEHQNFAVRKVDLQPNVDKTSQTEPMKKMNKKQIVSRPDSTTTPETESTHNFASHCQIPVITLKSEKTMNMSSDSRNQLLIDVIDLTTSNIIFEKAAQVQKSFDIVSLAADRNLPVQLHPGHFREDKKVSLSTLNDAKAEHTAATHLSSNKNGVSAHSVISPPLYIPPIEDQSHLSSPNLTANTEFVQVAAGGLRDSRLPEKKVVKDIDMRVQRANSRSSDKSCVKQKLMSPILDDGNGKDCRLTSNTLVSKLAKTGRPKKDNRTKISTKTIPAKERKDSVDVPSVPQTAVDVHLEENCKVVAIQNRTKRRTSSNASNSKRGKPSTTLAPEKGTHSEKSTHSEKCPNSEKELSKSSEGMLGITANGDEITSSTKKATLTDVGLDTSKSIKEKIDKRRKSETKHRSSAKMGSNKERVVDGRADGAPIASVTANKPVVGQSANSKVVDKNKIEDLLAKVKHPKDSNVALQKINKHHKSRKPSSGSEEKSKTASSSDQKNPNVNSDSQQKQSEHKMHGSNEKKLVSHKSSATLPVEPLKNKTSKIDLIKNSDVSNQAVSKHKKDSLKRKSSSDTKVKSQSSKKLKPFGEPDSDSSTADEKVRSAPKESRSVAECKRPKETNVPVTERALDENITKPARSSEKIPEKPIYKMPCKEMSEPNVDVFKVICKASVDSIPTLDMNPSSVHDQGVTSPATLSVAVEFEKSSEHFDAHCKHFLQPAESALQEMVEDDNTNSAPNIEETLTAIKNEIDDKSSIKKFNGNMTNISEAHIPVITISDDDDVFSHILPVMSSDILTSIVSQESSCTKLNTSDSDFSTFTLKEGMELIIDDSNFPLTLLEKEEKDVDNHSEKSYLPAEGIESNSPVASPPARTLWPINYNSVNDFPGRSELTKLVEYFILLNQDLIKFNDSFRIASRLDKINRRLDECRARRDLFMVINKVKPIITDLVTGANDSILLEGDLPELIYMYKELLPSEALKLRADTLSRKAIADIFGLIFEGTLDGMDFCKPESVIVYNTEQGLNPTNPMNLRYESVIRNLSSEHLTNFHSMSG